ncbi:MAG: sensor histidine kinase [Nitrososphaerota archaeon]
MFPPDTQQHDYFITFPLAFTHATYTFEGTDMVQGLETYRFSCKSKPYDITNAIPHFSEFAVFSFYKCVIWVEPVTGMHVDFLLEWESFFEENGQYTFLAEKGHKRTTPEYITKLVAHAKSQKVICQFLTIETPIIFGSVGTAILSIPVIANTKRERQLKMEKQIMVEREKQKDDFASMISHELKTPLVPIKGYLDMILSGKFGSLNEPIREKLEIIKKSTDSLNRLVNDLTDVQKIERKQLRLNLSENYLSDLINEVIVQMRPEFDKKGIAIIQNLQNIKCVCDRTRIEQVLINLLTNSIDFCPPNNGKITISLSSADKYAKIIVEDNGVGIPQESIDKIFVKFYQVDSSLTREHGGTGLGLSISRGIVEQHEGKIWAESKVGQGSTFTILLPKTSEQNIQTDKEIGLKKPLDKI